MPNHVYNRIIVPIEDGARLKKISEVGICEYFIPMPEELKDTKSPSEPNDELIQKYGYSDWYGWAVAHWGTKWNSYDNEYEEGIFLVDSQKGAMYSFTTAWSPPAPIMELFREEFKNFLYEWDEEQGYGQDVEVVDGVIVYNKSWDLPDWMSTDDDEISELKKEYEDRMGTHPAGYYRDYDLEHYLGKNYNWAKENKDEYVTKSNIRKGVGQDTP